MITNNTEKVMKMEKKEIKNFNKRIDIRDAQYQHFKMTLINR